MEKSIKNSKLEYPVQCHFRIIAKNIENIHLQIETVLLKMEITNPLEESNTSKKGTYKSFQFSTMVKSKEMMDRIDQELRQIDGVKMLL